MSSGPEFLTPLELSRRWKGMIGIGTLANWRASRKGPPYLKVGGRVLYKLADVLEWEHRTNGESAGSEGRIGQEPQERKANEKQDAPAKVMG